MDTFRKYYVYLHIGLVMMGFYISIYLISLLDFESLFDILPVIDGYFLF